MAATADTALAASDRPALPLVETPAWNMTLTVLLPDSYVLHPSSLEVIRDSLQERAPLVSTPQGRYLDILCSAFGTNLDAAKRDARRVVMETLQIFGLSPESVVEHTVGPFETVDELLAQLEPPAPMARVTHLKRDRGR